MRKMRSRFRKHGVAFFVKLAAVLLVSKRSCAQANDNDGCTNATLKGDYAITVSGQIFLPNGTVIQREGIATTHFDGAGSFTQVDFVLSSPNAGAPPGGAPVDPITGFHTQETGTYTVYSHCAGAFTIAFPSLTTTTGGSIPGAIIVVKFVLADRGRSTDTVGTSLTLLLYQGLFLRSSTARATSFNQSEQVESLVSESGTTPIAALFGPRLFFGQGLVLHG